VIDFGHLVIDFLVTIGDFFSSDDRAIKNYFLKKKLNLRIRM